MHWHAASYLSVVSSYAGGELCSLIGNLVLTKYIMIVTDSVSGITVSDDPDIIVVFVEQQSVSSQMVAEGGLKLTACLGALQLIESKCSDGGWTCNDADSLDALGLTGGKFSDGGWTCKATDSLDALGLKESKFSDGS